MGKVLPFPYTGMVARDPDPSLSIDPMASHQCAEFLEAHFKHIGIGAEFIMNGFFHLFTAELRNLKGYFAEDELNIMLWAMQDTVLAPKQAGRILVEELAVLQRLGGADSLYTIDWFSLNGRLKKLNAFQRAVVEIWAHGFWYGAGRGLSRKKDGWAKYRALLLP